MPHLYVIPARESSTALILRRGPSSWYHLILWKTVDDTFTHGAWFKGRIYEEKCDLSPDGQLFVYSALHGRGSDSGFPRIYTAVSRAPWLHALIVWPQDSTYGGGGQFIAPRTLWGQSSEHALLGYEVPTDRQFQVKRLHFASGPPQSRRSVAPVPQAHWTGLDFAGHTTFTKGDRLYRRVGNDHHLLADFSSLVPDPQPAPAWAKKPL